MSNTSSDQDLDSSPNQTITISSTQNLTLQSDEEDLHSDDSNFDLLDSRSFGKLFFSSINLKKKKASPSH